MIAATRTITHQQFNTIKNSGCGSLLSRQKASLWTIASGQNRFSSSISMAFYRSKLYRTVQLTRCCPSTMSNCVCSSERGNLFRGSLLCGSGRAVQARYLSPFVRRHPVGFLSGASAPTPFATDMYVIWVTSASQVDNLFLPWWNEGLAT